MRHCWTDCAPVSSPAPPPPTMPRGGAPRAAPGLPLVPAFEVNHLIGVEKYLRSAALLLRQV